MLPKDSSHAIKSKSTHFNIVVSPIKKKLSHEKGSHNIKKSTKAVHVVLLPERKALMTLRRSPLKLVM